MKTYLNEKELGEEYESLSLLNLLNKIKTETKDKVIEKIIINDIEVNEEFLQETHIDKEDIKAIKFITQRTDDLIEETLEQIDQYLPKLKKGVKNTADLFRKNETVDGNNKYQHIIKGLEWYTGVISKIISLLERDEIYKGTTEMLNKLNKTLIELMITHKKDDMILLADILEYEIVDYIDDFIELNQKIKLIIQKGKSEN